MPQKKKKISKLDEAKFGLGLIDLELRSHYDRYCKVYKKELELKRERSKLVEKIQKLNMSSHDDSDDYK